MGACLSAVAGGSSSESVSRRRSSCANVISANGNLRQYTISVTVSHVLRMEFETNNNTTPISSPDSTTSNIIKSSSTSSDKFFVCNSDQLYYDDYIPALDEEYQLQADQIYFVLPVSKLNFRLTASDMAALAVKASLALQKSSSKVSKTKKKAAAPSSSYSSSLRSNRSLKQNNMARISPFLEEEVVVNTNNYTIINNQRQRVVPYSGGGGNKPAGVGVLKSSSSSVRKLQRYSSKRAKMTVGSFRIRLATVYEGSVLQF